MQLKDQKVVIIGGSSGIGLAVAKKALEEGAHVLIASRSNEKLTKAKAQLNESVETRSVDMCDEAAITAFFKEIGAFDHLHLTAAEIKFGGIDDLSIADARQAFDSKFWGPYMAIKYAHDYISKKGSITLYSGAASQRPSKDSVALTAINSAIEGLARALALALTPTRVNVISPGITMTPLFENMGSDAVEQVYDAYKDMLLVKRYATAEEIAKTAAYLMTNNYVTGSLQSVDGGLSVT